MQHPSNELPTRTIPHEESQSSVSGFDPEAPQVNAKQLAAAEERRTLGKKESCAIFLLRFVVIALLFAVGVGSSLSVYFLAIDEGVDNFRTEFGFFGRQVIDKLNSAIERKLGALDSLSIEVTSHAIESGEEFPFVTTPHFEYKGSNSRIAGDTLLTLYLPIVTEENRPQWESYASNHSFHIAESYDREQRAKSMQDESYGLNQSTISDALLAVLAQGDDFGDMDYHIFYPEGGNANDEVCVFWYLGDSTCLVLMVVNNFLLSHELHQLFESHNLSTFQCGRLLQVFHRKCNSSIWISHNMHFPITP